MQLRGLNLNLLVVLEALLTERSTTRAGQKIYLSQSATSGALAQLREFFHDELLVSAGQKMVLTPLAETLVKPVHEIISSTEALIEKTAAFDPATSTRRFLLNMSDATGSMLLGKGLARIRKLAPGVQLEIVSFNEKVPDVIEQGEVDFIEVPDVMTSPFHPSELLFEDEYVCIGWSGNKALKKELTLERFLSMGQVTTRMLRRRDHLADLLLRDTGLKPTFELVVPVFGMVPHALLRTDLIALVNRRFAQYYSQYLPIKILPSPVQVRNLRMLLQWNRLHDHDEGTQWLRRILVEILN